MKLGILFAIIFGASVRAIASDNRLVSLRNQSINRGTAHLCIADPLGRLVNLRQGFWSRPVRVASADGRTNRGAPGDGP